MQRRLQDAQAGTETPDDFAPAVWDEWNAKSPRAKTDDALVADRALVEALEAVGDEEGTVLTFSMGPMTLDFPTFAGMRLNEHVFHTWDVEVALHGAATLAPDAVPLVVDNLGMIARFTARPIGEPAHDRHPHDRSIPRRHRDDRHRWCRVRRLGVRRA